MDDASVAASRLLHRVAEAAARRRESGGGSPHSTLGEDEPPDRKRGSFNHVNAKSPHTPPSFAFSSTATSSPLIEALEARSIMAKALHAWKVFFLRANERRGQLVIRHLRGKRRAALHLWQRGARCNSDERKLFMRLEAHALAFHSRIFMRAWRHGVKRAAAATLVAEAALRAMQRSAVLRAMKQWQRRQSHKRRLHPPQQVLERALSSGLRADSEVLWGLLRSRTMSENEMLERACGAFSVSARRSSLARWRRISAVRAPIRARATLAAARSLRCAMVTRLRRWRMHALEMRLSAAARTAFWRRRRARAFQRWRACAVRMGARSRCDGSLAVLQLAFVAKRTAALVRQAWEEMCRPTKSSSHAFRYLCIEALSRWRAIAVRAHVSTFLSATCTQHAFRTAIRKWRQETKEMARLATPLQSRPRKQGTVELSRLSNDVSFRQHYGGRSIVCHATRENDSPSNVLSIKSTQNTQCTEIIQGTTAGSHPAEVPAPERTASDVQRTPPKMATKLRRSDYDAEARRRNTAFVQSFSHAGDSSPRELATPHTHGLLVSERRRFERLLEATQRWRAECMLSAAARFVHTKTTQSSCRQAMSEWVALALRLQQRRAPSLAVAASRARLRAALRRAARRWRNSLLLRRAADFASRLSLRRAAHRWAMDALRRDVAWWGLAVLRGSRQRSARAWRRWREHARVTTLGRRAMCDCRARTDARRIAAAWRMWLRFCSRFKRRAFETLRRAFVAAAALLLRFSWQAWRERMGARLAARQIRAAAVEMVAARSVRTFAKWRDRVRDEAARKNASQTIIDRRRRASAVACVRELRAWSSGCGRRRDVADHAAARAGLSALTRSFDHWRLGAQRARIAARASLSFATRRRWRRAFAAMADAASARAAARRLRRHAAAIDARRRLFTWHRRASSMRNLRRRRLRIAMRDLRHSYMRAAQLADVAQRVREMCARGALARALSIWERSALVLRIWQWGRVHAEQRQLARQMAIWRSRRVRLTTHEATIRTRSALLYSQRRRRVLRCLAARAEDRAKAQALRLRALQHYVWRSLQSSVNLWRGAAEDHVLKRFVHQICVSSRLERALHQLRIPQRRGPTEMAVREIGLRAQLKATLLALRAATQSRIQLGFLRFLASSETLSNHARSACSDSGVMAQPSARPTPKCEGRESLSAPSADAVVAPSQRKPLPLSGKGARRRGRWVCYT